MWNRKGKIVLAIFEAILSFGPKCLVAAATAAALREQQVLEGLMCPTRTTG
jgi:hypothetical protein